MKKFKLTLGLSAILSFICFNSDALEIFEATMQRFSFTTEHFMYESYKMEPLFKELFNNKMIQFENFEKKIDISESKDTAPNLNPVEIGIDKYKVVFPGKKELYEFVGKKLPASPNYAFYGGFERSLTESIINYTAKSADEKLYSIFMRKNTSGSADETLPQMYSILRKNPAAFLKTFKNMSDEEKNLCVNAQYDFNLSVEENSFSKDTVAKLSKDLQKTAEQFNKMIQGRVSPH